MADIVDIAQEYEELERQETIAAIQFNPLVPGEPGDCDFCGRWVGRLVGGACGFCRDKYKLP